MKHVIRLLSVFVVAVGLAIAPAAAQDSAPAANLTAECAREYDPQVDYFPEKAAVEYAENFTVEYFNHYKVVTVTDAYVGAPAFQYVLVQCGTPAPDAADFPDGAQFIEVPAGDIISLTTTQIPHLSDLGLLDYVVGLDSFLYVSDPGVRAKIEAGEVVEVGSGADINIELVLDSGADLVMANGFNPETDAHPVLIEAGIFTALNADYREAAPLGQAEWIKFVAAFYNEEAAAEAVFADVVEQYEAARTLAAGVPEDERPTVLWNTYSTFVEAWSIPGAETYAGQLIRDAGGIIAPPELVQDDSAVVSFEAVYEAALDADIWVVNLFAIETVEDVIAMDERYADFAAVQNGNVWNNDRDVNENGGNNYYELGVSRPHLILQDLVALFHPDLLPDHTFNFYRRLPSAGE